MTFTAQHCFVDARNRKRKDLIAFHLLDEFHLATAEAGLEPGSWVRLSRTVLESVRAGYVKRLDVSLFLSLSSTLAQQLYRFLDARALDGKRVYRQQLRTLACEHLGLVRSYTNSQIKRELQRAHEELVAAGYLREVAYRPMKDGREMVVYRFPGKVPTQSAPNTAGLTRATVACQSAPEQGSLWEELKDVVPADPEMAKGLAMVEEWHAKRGQKP